MVEHRFYLQPDDLTAQTIRHELPRVRPSDPKHFVVLDLTELAELFGHSSPRGIAALVLEELGRATAKFPPFNSAHEGYAVLLEEVDELWDEVKRQKKDHPSIRAEAIQVAAMAIRFIRDVCDKGTKCKPH